MTDRPQDEFPSLRLLNLLTALDNVTLTPHSAWLTTEATDRLLVAGLRLLARHVADG